MPKIRFWAKNGKIFKNKKKLLGSKLKYFQTLRDIISSEQLSKLEKIKPFGHSKASIFFKKMPHFAHFPRPAETDPDVSERA